MEPMLPHFRIKRVAQHYFASVDRGLSGRIRLSSTVNLDAWAATHLKQAGSTATTGVG